ncbi:MAG: hypothetical protein AAGC71_08520 [Pseudomonadota bacterium]
MEVLLQYWDELDDALHLARFAVRRSPTRWLLLAFGLAAVGIIAGQL